MCPTATTLSPCSQQNRLIHVNNPKRRPSLKALGFNLAQRYLRPKPNKQVSSRKSIGGQEVLVGNDANQLLSSVVQSGAGTLVARLGTTENAVVKHYVENQVDGVCQFPWELKRAIVELSGFFPPDDHLLARFSRETMAHLREVDVMGVRSAANESEFWPFEDFFLERFSDKAQLVELGMLMPIGDPDSWTRNLRDKKVLVIHPFADSITAQFKVREKIFPQSDFLPDCELQVLKAVQSVGDNHKNLKFDSWFAALDAMTEDIAKRDFDVALVGAGAYGLFLAAACKKLGKPAIHIGGALQLLFGIKGRRWTDPLESASSEVLPYVNAFWSSPLPAEIPSGASKVEDGCYWA